MNFIKSVKTVYNRSYDRRPILTLCITNGILGAISDQLAQTITYIDYHRNIDKKHRQHPYSAILDNRLPEQLRKHEDLWLPPPSFDAFRTVRFALYNFCVAPIVGKWYMVLDRFFPMPAAAAANRVKDIVAIKRMCTDQVLFAPASLAVFFTTMGYAETQKWGGVLEKFRDAYTPALTANYKVWPLVQLINFKVMPIQYRLPFVSSLGILWNSYLSWINNASKQEENIQEKMHLG